MLAEEPPDVWALRTLIVAAERRLDELRADDAHPALIAELERLLADLEQQLAQLLDGDDHRRA